MKVRKILYVIRAPDAATRWRKDGERIMPTPIDRTWRLARQVSGKSRLKAEADGEEEGGVSWPMSQLHLRNQHTLPWPLEHRFRFSENSAAVPSDA